MTTDSSNRPWVRVHRSFEEAEQAERERYLRMSPAERVAAVEEMRRRWMTMKGLDDQGLRRVVRVSRQ